MTGFDPKDISEHIYRNAKFTIARAVMYGEFPEEETVRSGLRYFKFRLGDVNGLPADDGGRPLPHIEDAVLSEIDIKAVDDKAEVTVEFTEFKDSERICHKLHFFTSYLNTLLCRYEDFSYRNVFKEDDPLKKEKQWYKPEFLISSEEYDIGKGIKAVIELYGEEPADPDKNIGAHLAVGKYVKEGRVTSEHFTLPQHRRHFTEPIHHSNGYLYLSYKTDLYGISFFEIDTGKHYDYVPEGDEHDHRQPIGESFIILSEHYDPESDLLACNGCYWGGSDEVYVMDFSDPLHFDPRMVRLYDKFYELYDDDEIDGLYFKRWEADSLVLKGDNGSEYKFQKARIMEMLNEKRAEYPLDEFDR